MTPYKENVPGKCCVSNGVHFGGCGLPVTDIEAGQLLSRCISGLQVKQEGLRSSHDALPVTFR